MIIGCHNGPNLVIDYQGVEVYGASEGEAKMYFMDFDLVISMTSVNFDWGINRNRSRITSEGLKGLVEMSKGPEILSLDWPDMGIPQLPKVFWSELAKVVKKRGSDRARRNKKYKIVVHCMGGHGRTGTALALLLHFITGESADLVRIVREKHCSKAVESQSQIDYIEYLTGVKVEKHGSKDYSKKHEKVKLYKDSSIITSGSDHSGYDHTEFTLSSEFGFCLETSLPGHGTVKHYRTMLCKDWKKAKSAWEEKYDTDKRVR